VEAVATEIAEGALIEFTVTGVYTLGSILHHQQAPLLGDGVDRVHLRGHSGVVHRSEDPGAVRDRRFDE
jgi:hypothetical protein